MEIKTFLMYKEWQPVIEAMTDEQAGKLLKAIYAYQINNEVNITDGLLLGLFNMMKTKFETDATLYKEKCEKNKENGLKGGRPKKQTKPKETERLLEETEKKPKEKKETERLLEETEKKPKEKKETYGTGGNVKLTVKEYEKLVADYGADKTQKAIELLDGYIADKGYKSKDNNRALRRWVFDAVEEQEQKRAKINGNSNIRPVDKFFADEMAEIREMGIL